jgi:DNA-binding protein HU-beta
MKKTELIDAIAAATGESQAASARALDALIAVISKEVSAGGEVSITGFGSFKVGQRSERTGRNPRTGEPLTIAATRTIRFVPGATLKAAISETPQP